MKLFQKISMSAGLVVSLAIVVSTGVSAAVSIAPAFDELRVMKPGAFTYQGSFVHLQTRAEEVVNRAYAKGESRYRELLAAGYDCQPKSNRLALCAKNLEPETGEDLVRRIHEAHEKDLVVFGELQAGPSLVEDTDIFRVWSIQQSLEDGGVRFNDHRIYQHQDFQSAWFERGSMRRSYILVSQNELRNRKIFSLRKGSETYVHLVDVQLFRAAQSPYQKRVEFEANIH